MFGLLKGCGAPQPRVQFAPIPPKKPRMASFVSNAEGTMRRRWHMSGATNPPVELAKWIGETGSLLAARSKEDSTHYTLDGFKFRVSPENEKAFVDVVGESLRLGRHMYIIERRTEVFRMHFDFDVVDDHEVVLDEVVEMLATAVGAMSKYYPGADPSIFHAVLLAAPPKPTKGAIKTGFHPVFPNLFVTTEQALQMRTSCMAALERRFGKRHEPKNTWGNLVDDCVFLANGLRMMGSRKKSKCTECKGARRSGCAECGGGGFKDEGRAYVPVTAIDHEGNVLEPVVRQCADAVAASRLCSIRSLRTEPTPGYEVPLGAPACPELHCSKAAAAKRTKHRSARADTIGFADDARASKGFRVTEMLDPSSELFDAVESFVRRRMPEMYRAISIRKIMYNKERTHYMCWTCGEGSSYCYNVRRDHTTNTIYFSIGEDGVRQRCFSRKEKDPVAKVLCKKWGSPPIPLPENLRRAMFPAAAAAASIAAPQNAFGGGPPATVSGAGTSEGSVGDEHAGPPPPHLVNMRAVLDQSRSALEAEEMRMDVSSSSGKRSRTAARDSPTLAGPAANDPHPVFEELTVAECERMSMREIAALEYAQKLRVHMDSERMRKEAFSGEGSGNKKKRVPQRGGGGAPPVKRRKTGGGQERSSGPSFF